MTETRTLFNGRYLRLMQQGSWEYAERTEATSAVIVVAVTPEDRVLFVEQFRIPVGCRSIEMPAGLVGDLGAPEPVEAAAQRELLEETGWHAERIEFLMQGPSSSGMSNEQVAFVRAHGLRRVHAGGGDESENITVHEIPRLEAAAWLEGRRRAGSVRRPLVHRAQPGRQRGLSRPPGFALICPAQSRRHPA
jgi:ADP-ribose pyrophosphatase